MARRRTGPVHHIRCGCASICSYGTWLFSDWAQKELADKTNWMAALLAEACRKHIRSSSPGAMARLWSHPSRRYVAQAPGAVGRLPCQWKPTDLVWMLPMVWTKRGVARRAVPVIRFDPQPR